jgi:putative oxidoreductase
MQVTITWGEKRVALGILFLAHVSVKIFIFKPAGTAGYFRSLGLPGWLAYLTIAAELGGGLFLLVGIFPRYVALALIPLMLGTIVTVHGKAGWLFTNTDGGWEYPAFWSVALLVLALLGDGMWALVPSSQLRAWL